VPRNQLVISLSQILKHRSILAYGILDVEENRMHDYSIYNGTCNNFQNKHQRSCDQLQYLTMYIYAFLQRCSSSQYLTPQIANKKDTSHYTSWFTRSTNYTEYENVIIACVYFIHTITKSCDDYHKLIKVCFALQYRYSLLIENSKRRT